MSGYHEEQWAEMATLSKRIINLEQRMLERLLALEAEVKALKGQTQAQTERTIYPDARDINWRERGMAKAAIAVIMQK
jgi:hypothetical protein